MTDSVNSSFVENRRARIAAQLDREGSVRVSDLADQLSVSKVTIRGDLDALERDGRLRRTHGGAVALSKTVTVSVQDRRVNVSVEAKLAIAQRASQLVPDGASVLVDSGTTSIELVRALADKEGITLVTNDFTIADLVDRSLPATDVIVLGGLLNKGHRYVSGPMALRTLGALHPDIAFVCPTSFVPGRGLMTNNQAMAELKTAFLACADTTYVLMDASKVGAPGLIRFARLTDADAVIMDADPSGEVTVTLDGTSTELILA